MHLNFCGVSQGSKTNLFPKHLVFLISGDIKENHVRHCPIPEREKQDPQERSWLLNTIISYGKTRCGQTSYLGLMESQAS